MNPRAVLVCTLLVACSRGGKPTPLPYSYLVTPAGHMYRVLKIGPVTGAEGKRLGTMVSYAGETRAIAGIGTDAEALAAALGPEYEDEPSLIVQSNVGYDPRKMFSTSTMYNVVFERRDGSWRRLPPRSNETKDLDGGGAFQPPEDPTFPFDPAGLKVAADAAAGWAALLDDGKTDASSAALSETFRSQMRSEEWRGVVAKRSGLGKVAKRTELYRVQVRNTTVPDQAGTAATVDYLVETAQGARLVERISLLKEKESWLVAGYAVRPLK